MVEFIKQLFFIPLCLCIVVSCSDNPAWLSREDIKAPHTKEWFYNLDSREPKTFFDEFKWRVTRKIPRWPQPNNLLYTLKQDSDYTVSHLNHASVLIKFKDQSIITDPLWSSRIHPYVFFQPYIYKNIQIDPKEIKKIDYVLISHDHYDHLNFDTLKKIIKKFKVKIFTGIGHSKLFTKHSISVTPNEFDWWDSYKASGVEINFVPAHHWSGRFLNDSYKRLWGGYVVKDKLKTIYFSGDTGFGSGDIFRQLKKKYVNFDLCILPIGSYSPLWFMNEFHLTPEEAIEAAGIMDCKKVLPIHYNSIRLSDEPFSEPFTRFKRAGLKKGFKLNQLLDNRKKINFAF